MNISSLPNLIRNGWLLAAGALVVGASLASCSMINEDLDPCAPPPHVRTIVDFEYTYNMSPVLNNTGEEEDWFFDHAGSVYLYIFDEDGYYIESREKHKEFFNKGEDFSMEFGEDELIPGETYNLVAVAQGNTIGYDGSDNYNWFKVVNPMKPGISKIEDYILKLDRDTNNDGFTEVGVINYKDQYGRNQQMIDTLWTTKPDQVQTITIPKLDYKPSVVQLPDSINKVTIPMMRITNAITVNVISDAFNQANNPNVDDYHIVIHFPNGNGTVDFTGNTLPAQELYYQSLIKEICTFQQKSYKTRASGDFEPDDDTKDTDCLSAKFGVSRLQVGDKSSLQVRAANQEGYPVLAEIKDFSEELALLLNEYYRDDQEFLDREYDFTVNLRLDNLGNVVWYEMGISVMNWVVRVNMIGF